MLIILFGVEIPRWEPTYPGPGAVPIPAPEKMPKSETVQFPVRANMHEKATYILCLCLRKTVTDKGWCIKRRQMRAL